jgi:hypothetical protein
MSEPHADVLAKLEAIRGQPRTFHDRLDGEYLDLLVQERADVLGAMVNLIPRSTQRNPRGSLESPGVDGLDGDVIDPEFLDFEGNDQRKLNFSCIVEHNPSKQMLKKFGIDELREVVFHFSLKALRDAGLVTEAKFRGVDLGDLVEWDGTWYIAHNVHRNSYFGQSDRFLTVSAFCDRYRLNTIDETSKNNVLEADP